MLVSKQNEGKTLDMIYLELGGNLHRIEYNDIQFHSVSQNTSSVLQLINSIF